MPTRGYHEISALMELLAADLPSDIIAELDELFTNAVGRAYQEAKRRGEQAERDRIAASLLPRGAEVVQERLGVARSTVYKMLHRHRRSLRAKQPA